METGEGDMTKVVLLPLLMGGRRPGVRPMSVEDSTRYFRNEQYRYAALVKKAGVTLD